MRAGLIVGLAVFFFGHDFEAFHPERHRRGAGRDLVADRLRRYIAAFNGHFVGAAAEFFRLDFSGLAVRPLYGSIVPEKLQLSVGTGLHTSSFGRNFRFLLDTFRDAAFHRTGGDDAGRKLGRR